MKIGSLARNKIFISQSHLFLFSFIVSIIVFACSSDKTELISISGSTMGTTYTVKVVSLSNKNNPDLLKSKIDSILVKINQQMSTYIKDSELSQFNSSTDTAWRKVSTALSSIMQDAIDISIETNNFYDITIGPIVNLWGFGPELIPTKIPTDDEINRVRNKTGIDKLIVDIQNSKIKKKNSNLYCDLSSIAKGYGVDRVGKYLEESGELNYMVEIGGEVRAKGKNNNSENWKIGISTPLGTGLQKVVSLANVSIATSGDYLNYFEKDGIRYSHLINTKTGRPITHNLASVTVIHNDCSFADAFATAINVMGTDQGYKFALKKKLPVFMIVRENGNFLEKMTPEFKEYIEVRK